MKTFIVLTDRVTSFKSAVSHKYDLEYDMVDSGVMISIGGDIYKFIMVSSSRADLVDLTYFPGLKEYSVIEVLDDHYHNINRTFVHLRNILPDFEREFNIRQKIIDPRSMKWKLSIFGDIG